MERKRIYYHCWTYNLAGNSFKQYLIIFISFSFIQSQNVLKTIPIIEELGCGNCHSGVTVSTILLNRAPDLSYAGLKYNEAFLFDYLKSPQKIRYNIGNSRMPNFGFSDDEALALTKYLMSRNILPDGISIQSKSIKSNNNGFDLIHQEYQCTACHTLNGVGQLKSTDLNTATVRLQNNWLYDLLLNPDLYVPKKSPMPKFFEKGDLNDEKNITKMIGFLSHISKDKMIELERELNKSKQKYPKISKKNGKNIFLSQNCQACHKMNGEENWFVSHNAPDLTAQKMKTKPIWLMNYLQSTPPIRPNGYFPGTGSRMPNYNLTKVEIEKIYTWLGKGNLKTKFKTISPFQSQKVKKLLNDHYSCLGCHQLNGKGGKIGPDLSNVGNRLTDGYIKMAIEMPHMVMPESIMPKIEIPQNLLPLVQSFLSNNKNNNNVKYANLISTPPYKIDNAYKSNCAPCHGLKGDGFGFNASNLDVSPGNFTDGKKISLRSDNALYDTIYGGGRIMNKNHFMPPWGQKFDKKEIVEYVSKIRKFCECEPPDWSKN